MAVDTVVDLAEINGRVFVNNASMGVYTKIVQSGDYRDAKVHTAAAMLPDLLGPEATPLDLRSTLPSGQEANGAQLLLVSNNPYALARLRGGGAANGSTVACSASPSCGWTRLGRQKARRLGRLGPGQRLLHLGGSGPRPSSRGALLASPWRSVSMGKP